MPPDIRIKRVYEPADPRDGFRVLVDRVWPRGMTKERVQADLWLKEAAPGTELRKWYCHDPLKWEEFKILYFQELDAKPEIVARLLNLALHKPLTLLFASHEQILNQAAALKEYLLSKSGSGIG
jgi:uncharacterized protein YeaO (DUF488 family)